MISPESSTVPSKSKRTIGKRISVSEGDVAALMPVAQQAMQGRSSYLQVWTRLRTPQRAAVRPAAVRRTLPSEALNDRSDGLVVDPLEVEPVRRGRRSGLAARAPLEERSEVAAL